MLHKVNRIFNGSIAPYFMVDVSLKGLAALFIPLFAKFMGPEDLGLYVEWFAVYSVVSALICLGIPSYYLVVSIKKGKGAEIEAHLFKVFLEWSFLIVVASCIFGLFLNGQLFYVFAIILAAFSFFFIEFAVSNARLENDINFYALLQFFMFLSTVSIPFVAVLLTPTFDSRALAFVLSLSFVSLFCFVKMNRKIVRKRDVLVTSEVRVSVYKYGLPLVSIALFSWLKLGGDLQFLKSYGGYGVAGNMGLAFQILAVVSIAGASLNRAASVKLYSFIKNEDNDGWYKAVTKMSFLVAVLGIISYGLFYLIIHFWLSEYTLALKFYGPMMVGTVFYCAAQFWASRVIYKEKTYILTVCLIVSSLLHPIFSYVINLTFGYEFLGYSTLFSNIIFLVLLLCLCRKFCWSSSLP
ncbi:hypothetical protein [Marinobacter sp. S0848L]|uniref:hypothetical protein n=1 Tax=Marinobacter sp. S0848L TaxID=2926423 RepID=UPI001FF465DE|nr:hypothetical protein [Marinobacter sp. S0848L]MCK0107315.1 hypothetical protein [Marinobacter sp. S0848L]